MDPNALHAWQIADAVSRGELRAEDACAQALARIDAHDSRVRAFLALRRDEATNDARAVDEKRARGEKLGRLAGVPVAIKDAIVTRGTKTTCASRVLDGWTPPYDATVIERLRAEDAIVVGKTNMDEFAMGSSTEHSAFFATKNPWDVTRTPGGSSGGSAAAVSARMTPVALGSDTGGSIRQPASFTGVFGMKPTYGRVSRYGLVAFASSLDQIGPFATDVRGAARVLDVISGACDRDMTALPDAPLAIESACGADVRGLRIGVPAEYFGEGLAKDVEARVREGIAALADAGATVVPVRLEHTSVAVATYYVIATAEASSNLSRYDGVRFGLRAKDATSLGEMIERTRALGFGNEVKRRILLGTFVLSSGYYEAYYGRAMRVRTLIVKDFERAFAEVDAVVSPVAPTTAFGLGELVDDPLAMYLSDAYTLPASLAGLPAASVPLAPAPSGLPVGLHVVAKARDEATVVKVASAVEARFPPRPAPSGSGA
jgi:aspartyl-tRNA(Asn)/glutamyl-tRNA(Gln) amidotransferase subunit A